MARSHHRKKHREHVRQFKQHQENTGIPGSSKVKGSSMFLIVGVLVGGAVGYFASGSLTWILIGVLAGGVLGYLFGRKVDTTS